MYTHLNWEFASKHRQIHDQISILIYKFVKPFETSVLLLIASIHEEMVRNCSRRYRMRERERANQLTNASTESKYIVHTDKGMQPAQYTAVGMSECRKSTKINIYIYKLSTSKIKQKHTTHTCMHEQKCKPSGNSSEHLNTKERDRERTRAKESWHLIYEEAKHDQLIINTTQFSKSDNLLGNFSLCIACDLWKWRLCIVVE